SDGSAGGDIEVAVSDHHRTPYPSHERSTRWCPPEERRGTNSNSESNQEDLSVHWQKCYNTLAEYDSKVISMWTDEMNTILVFASVYAAVVTGFLIESYKGLREDPIEALLTCMTSRPDPVTNPASLEVPFTPSASNVAINTVWFSSLILALSAVLTAILIKQWLFHYNWTNSIPALPPHLAIGLRHLSLASLTQEHGQGIYHAVAFPPLLLIVSLFLFFAGLITLLWTLNYIVAGVISFLTSFTVMYFVYTTIAPSFNPTSVYRSIQAWKFYR
ncbi:hypothetical protein EDD85DRAFT_973310, partial [Armillaria nabsnona]